MEKVDLREIKKIEEEKNIKSKFHFTKNEETLKKIEEEGLIPVIGDNSSGIDTYDKIFYSDGLDAMLQTAEVWLDYEAHESIMYLESMWRRNGEINIDEEEIGSLIKVLEYISDKYDTDKSKKQIEEIIGKINDIDKKYEINKSANRDEIFTNKKVRDLTMERAFHDFKNRRYITFDYNPKNTYIDENKINEKRRQSEYFQKAYGGKFSNFNHMFSDKWNMYTTENIPAEKIKQVVIAEKEDAFSIIKENYITNLNINKEDFKRLEGLFEYEKERKKLIEGNEEIKHEKENEIKDYEKYREKIIKKNSERLDEYKEMKDSKETIENNFFKNKFFIFKKEYFAKALKNIQDLKISGEEIKIDEETKQLLEDFENETKKEYEEYLEKEEEKKQYEYQEKFKEKCIELFEKNIGEYEQNQKEITRNEDSKIQEENNKKKEIYMDKEI